MKGTFVYIKVTSLSLQTSRLLPESRRGYRPLGSILVGLLLSAVLLAQAVHPVSGRRIAPVMGVGGADWLERTERELEEQPAKALDAIGIKPGMTVADIGAGVGYFVVRLAERVGPSGKVYANDIQPEMLRRLRTTLEKQNIRNVETILSKETDPMLPSDAMDVILMVDVYHEFSQPQRMLAGIRKALKKDGRLVLLEYRKEDPYIPIRPEHKMSVAEVKAELEPEGFRFVEAKDGLPRQHILIFRKNIM
jgi:SAM-dependent methyltransferase